MAGKGGKTEGAGRPQGAKKIHFRDYVTAEEQQALVDRCKKMAEKDPSMMRFMMEHLFGKAKESLDVNNTGTVKMEVTVIDAINKVYGKSSSTKPDTDS